MAGVVASNVRNIRAKSLSLKDTQDQEAEVLRKMQQRQDQITANNQWKQKVVIRVSFYTGTGNEVPRLVTNLTDFFEENKEFSMILGKIWNFNVVSD